MANDMHWVGTWATAPAPAEGAAFSNQTLRMNARVSIGGSTLRVRLSNLARPAPVRWAIGMFSASGVRRSNARRRICAAAVVTSSVVVSARIPTRLTQASKSATNRPPAQR